MFATHVSNTGRWPRNCNLKITHMRTLTIILSFLFLLSNLVCAQDIRGGEITATYLSANTYSFNVFLYTKTSMLLDHSTVLLDYGDGVVDTLTGTETQGANDITEWYYSSSHTFPGQTIYFISLTDSLRISGIQNITNSETVGIKLKYNLFNYTVVDSNSSPVFNYNQITVSSDGSNFIHDASASDNNGDSLTYQLWNSTPGNYSSPIGATINVMTGEFQMPIANGVFAINIRVNEWRDGAIMGTISREMIIDSSWITSINDAVVKDETIKVYLHQHAELIKVESDAPLRNISIYSIDGRVVYRINNIGVNTINISSGNLVGGLYMVVVSNSDGKRKVEKLVFGISE